MSGYCVIFNNSANNIQIGKDILSYKHWNNPKGTYRDNINLIEIKDFLIKEFEVFHVSY